MYLKAWCSGGGGGAGAGGGGVVFFLPGNASCHPTV